MIKKLNSTEGVIKNIMIVNKSVNKQSSCSIKCHESRKVYCYHIREAIFKLKQTLT